MGGDGGERAGSAVDRRPGLREIRDETGETACVFRAEHGFRVCVAIAETRHVLRRDMYVGRIIPRYAGSAGRILPAWNPDLAEQVLSAPLEPLTEGTVTSPAELRTLIAQGKADGYAISAGEREDSASEPAPIFERPEGGGGVDGQRSGDPDAARTVRGVGGSARRLRRADPSHSGAGSRCEPRTDGRCSHGPLCAAFPGGRESRCRSTHRRVRTPRAAHLPCSPGGGDPCPLHPAGRPPS
ncbi:IclR family transcriptional regulator domain-containing protein [Nocardia flavorosea]|uniref:IclR family transcriptional regulator domain-containing protein n=1 Tax=Nocardia flavorosea TaxID=53429 RepID=UPI003CC80519